jgi:hypothetical protein
MSATRQSDSCTVEQSNGPGRRKGRNRPGRRAGRPLGSKNRRESLPPSIWESDMQSSG